jgi:hypothetical protein
LLLALACHSWGRGCTFCCGFRVSEKSFVGRALSRIGVVFERPEDSLYLHGSLVLNLTLDTIRV